MSKNVRALALLSGGLDSVLAARVVMEQGVEVIGIYFSAPFWSNEKKEAEFIKRVAGENGLEIKVVPVGDEYVDIIQKPEYGWGKAINPCVDCKVFMLKKAKKLLREFNAQFLITGEVVGQRPMSQHKSALNYIEKHADVRGVLLRPLSAKILPETEIEKQGLVDREKLINISGRSRKIQKELADKYGIHEFTSPAGGCLLTDERFAKKLKDLFDHMEHPLMSDIEILKYGRHFRYNNSKIIVGRDQSENELLLKNMKEDDHHFVALNCGSPDVILHGEVNDDAIEFAAKLTAAYSNSKNQEVTVKHTVNGKASEMQVEKTAKEDANPYNLTV